MAGKAPAGSPAVGKPAGPQVLVVFQGGSGLSDALKLLARKVLEELGKGAGRDLHPGEH